MFFLFAGCSQDIIDQPRRVITPGGRTTFSCRLSAMAVVGEIEFYWLVNGTRLEDLNQGDGIIETGVLFGVGHIEFSNIPVEYNDTTIQCITTLTSGIVTPSNNATLLVQGLLSAIGFLNVAPIPLDSIIFLTWIPPFSLDITNVDPDITYCVDVVNSTSSSPLMIYSKCGITDTQYNYTISPNSTACDNYIFIITPVNIVGNGTTASEVLLSSITEAPQTVENEDLRYISMKHNSIAFNFKKLPPAMAICSYSLDLYDILNTTHKYSMMEYMYVPTNQNNLRIRILFYNDDGSSNLNRLLTGTVSLINSFGTTPSAINISTHAVQDITYNIQDEPITITIDYINNTEALGALLALMYLDQDGNIVCDQSIYATIRRSDDDFTLPMGDPAITNTYMGLAYDIERNGIEDNAYPAVRRRVDIGHDISVSSDGVSGCPVIYKNGTASVSCSNQVILLQNNDPYNLTVVNVRPGEKQTVPVVPNKYCIMELHVPMRDNFDSKVKYFREFNAEENTMPSPFGVAIGSCIGVLLFLCAVATIISLFILYYIKKSRRVLTYMMSKRDQLLRKCTRRGKKSDDGGIG